MRADEISSLIRLREGRRGNGMGRNEVDVEDREEGGKDEGEGREDRGGETYCKTSWNNDANTRFPFEWS